MLLVSKMFFLFFFSVISQLKVNIFKSKCVNELGVQIMS